MGDTLSTAVQAFSAEFEKDANVIQGLGEVASRLANPLKGLMTGMKQLSPTNLIREGGEMGEALHSAVNRTSAAARALKTGRVANAVEATGKPMTGAFGGRVSYDGGSMLGRARAQLATHLRAGTHLMPNAKPSGGIRGLAEQMSRSGWTGEGAVTKYLPVGQKGMIATGTLASMPGIVNSVRYGPNAESGGVGEQVGSLAGFTLPAVMFGGMPHASLIAPMIGGFAGGRLGRAVDQRMDPRVRAMEQAMPEESGQ